MSFTVLSIAYPFAPVTADPVGGAEQVLSQLDRAIVARGQSSVVIAHEGSEPAGKLVGVQSLAGEIDESGRQRVYAEMRRLITKTVAERRPDVIHFHGLDFHHYLPARGPPALVTLHLPLTWYPSSALRPLRQDVWLLPVSLDQARRGPEGLRLSKPIENGVDLAAFKPGRKRRFALALGRICPEKGFHLALDAARAAGAPLLLAGQVFPYREHLRYFETEIRPRLDRFRRWIGPVTGAPKRRLMAAASCLVAPSLAPETSSITARESLAAGTPVVAFHRGALREIIDPGRTGVLVDRTDQLPDAIRAAVKLASQDCRHVAENRFSADRMIAAYMSAYQSLADHQELPMLDAAEAR